MSEVNGLMLFQRPFQPSKNKSFRDKYSVAGILQN